MTFARPTTPRRIIELAAATLARKGAAVPIHWHGGAVDAGPQEIEQTPTALLAAAASRLERPEEAAGSDSRALTPAGRQEALRRAARRITERLAQSVAGLKEQQSNKASARDVLTCLVEVALDQAHRRGYRAAPSQVTYMIGVEIVAWAFDVSRPTLWRRLEELRELGLIDTRRWFTTVQGEGRTAGTLVSVRLTPGAAKVHHDALAGDWRDLERDIKHRQTWRQRRLNALSTPEGTEQATQYVKTIALPPRDSIPPVSLMRSNLADSGANVDLAELFDLPGVDRADRAGRVDALAGALAGRLRDSGSRDMYRWAIWQALRLADQGQPQYLAALHNAAQTVISDAADPERLLRRPGARFVAILRLRGVWDALKSAPQTRVGALAVAA